MRLKKTGVLAKFADAMRESFARIGIDFRDRKRHGPLFTAHERYRLDKIFDPWNPRGWSERRTEVLEMHCESYNRNLKKRLDALIYLHNLEPEKYQLDRRFLDDPANPKGLNLVERQKMLDAFDSDKPFAEKALEVAKIDADNFRRRSDVMLKEIFTQLEEGTILEPREERPLARVHALLRKDDAPIRM